MKENVFHTLKERGFVYQTTDDQALEKLLGRQKVTCYIGFDATADSLHVGSLVPIMGLVHMQRCGHRSIALLGGGTTLVGDPSGKTEMRQMLSLEQIKASGEKIKKQFSQYLSFEKGQALLLNNADWLVPLNYIEFLRDIGRHFSVNRMLTVESVKQRLLTGLSFLEFNYMLLQAYDFYILARDYNCVLQMGGQDQWGNIVAGSDLTRRMINKQIYGMTFPLITTSSGEKFGKSAGNAVWLDKKMTSPYDFYQYWRNVDDRDVEKYLGLFTLLPMEEVKRLPKQNVNRAKEILAYEVTRLTHGKEQADRAYKGSIEQFAESDPDREVLTVSGIMSVNPDTKSKIPTEYFSDALLSGGTWIVKLMVMADLCSSNGEARRLIKQGGVYLNDEQITDENKEISEDDLVDGTLLLRVGKKRYKRIVFK
ncbi:tyrosine--tRNA ligase [bacterium]|nr:tyrosine--tRNA ligase [bacterium]RQV94367.1 MAG: tyrosine--tRNA ligase [bacterium]